MKLDDAYVAGKKLAAALGSVEVGYEVGRHCTCGEADDIAGALRLLDQPDAAAAWLKGHGEADEPGDTHYVPEVNR